MNPEPLTGVYALTLRAPDGRERRMLAWLPTEPVRQEFYEKARRSGIEIIDNSQFTINNSQLNAYD